MSTYNAKAHSGFAGYDRPETDSTLTGVGRLLATLAAWSQERRDYREALTELRALSDRNLADIGIFRADIQAVARDAARAKRAERSF